MIRQLRIMYVDGIHDSRQVLRPMNFNRTEAMVSPTSKTKDTQTDRNIYSTQHISTTN